MTPGKSTATPAREGQTPKPASAGGLAYAGGFVYLFQVAIIIALITTLVFMYVKGSLGKKNAFIALAGYAVGAAIPFAIGKVRGQGTWAFMGRAG
jgi:hypothetical protein